MGTKMEPNIPNPNITLHPLYLPEILERVFEFLPLRQDLSYSCRSCTEVCQLWRDVLHDKIKKCREGPLEPVDSASVDCTRLMVNIPARNLSAVTSVVQTKGDKLKELQLNFDDEHGTSINYSLEVGSTLLSLRHFCRNIQKLVVVGCKSNLAATGTLHSSIEALSSLHFCDITYASDIHGRGRGLMNELIDCAKNIKVLTFKNCDSPTLLEKLPRIKWPALVDHLVINRCVTELCVDIVPWSQWVNLQKLTIGFEGYVSRESIRNLLSGVRNTLTHLVLTFQVADVYYEMSDDTDQLLIPVTMEKLKSLVLEFPYKEAVDTIYYLANALLLPKLRDYQVSGLSLWTDDFELPDTDFLHLNRKRLNVFNGLWSTGKPVKDKSEDNLKCLRIINQTLQDGSLFTLSPNPFESLTELHVESGCVEVYLSIFERLPLLERLSIVINSHEPTSWNVEEEYTSRFPHLQDKRLDWDEVLSLKMKCNDCFDFDDEFPNLLLIPTGTPSMRDLKRLKYLSIDANVPNLLSDFFIHENLIYISSLQHVRILEHKFSEAGIANLRSELPHCHLEFDKVTSEYYI